MTVIYFGPIVLFKVCGNAYFIVFSRVWGFQRKSNEGKNALLRRSTSLLLFFVLFLGGRGGVEGLG